MKPLKIVLFVLSTTLLGYACENRKPSTTPSSTGDMMIRLSEIEIHADYLDAYLAILTEESAASVRLEPGVIAIYPMFQKATPTEIRILEIYANTDAYESHLQASHFKHYKSETSKMVKSLKLVDMEAIDKETMADIFNKLN